MVSHADAHDGSLLDILDGLLSPHAKGGRLRVSVTGSGGKTSGIERLARYWANQGFSVAISTSTRMAHPDIHRYDIDTVAYVDKGDATSAIEAVSGKVVLMGVPEGTKISAPSDALLDSLCSRFDRTLVEGDGARGLPLKIHAERDPLVVGQSDVVLALLGLGALGKPLDERVMYLSGRYRELTGDGRELVDGQVYRNLLEHPEGVFKRCGELPVVVLCNQSDLVSEAERTRCYHAMSHRWEGRDHALLMGSLKTLCVHQKRS